MHVVIGAAFGDEGKGLVTQYLASYYGKDARVVRFNGGAQAGHTVVTEQGRHVFRHLGSGTFSGAKTFLSRFFVSNPILFLEEIKQLHLLKLHPLVSVDPASPVTTPYDMMINQIVEESRGKERHGSCGVGFGETIERNLHSEFSLTVEDLENRNKTTNILESIRRKWLPQRLRQLNVDYISNHWQSHIESIDVLEHYLNDLLLFLDKVTIERMNLKNTLEPVIFEGAQGLMLDQDRGCFPHVTRSHTGLKNVLALLEYCPDKDLNVVYVTRNYFTRHGAGPLAHELSTPPYKRVVDDTNVTNKYQGNLRYAWCDVDSLTSFIHADLALVPSNMKINHKLAVTCLDQADDEIIFVQHQKVRTESPASFCKVLAKAINVSGMLCSYGPTLNTIQERRV